MSAVRNGVNHEENSVPVEDDFEEIRIPVPWGHMSGKWWGSRSDQPILAIHGWQDNAGTFDTLAPILKQQGISLLCIDLPGHGFSSHYGPGHFYYIFWDGVHLVRRIVQYYNWSKITLLGHSLGGAISFLYAAIYPDEVEKYISIDIAGPIAREPSTVIDLLGNTVDRFLKFEKLSQDLVPCYDYDEMIDIVEEAHRGSVNRKGCELLMKRGMRPSKTKSNKYIFSRDVRLKAMGLALCTLDEVLEFASRIKCEVLNIRGNPGMKFDKPEFYDGVIDKLKENAKKVEYHIVPGTHHLHLNNPERIADIIEKFLKS